VSVPHPPRPVVVVVESDDRWRQRLVDALGPDTETASSVEDAAPRLCRGGGAGAALGGEHGDAPTVDHWERPRRWHGPDDVFGGRITRTGVATHQPMGANVGGEPRTSHGVPQLGGGCVGGHEVADAASQRSTQLSGTRRATHTDHHPRRTPAEECNGRHGILRRSGHHDDRRRASTTSVQPGRGILNR